LDTGRTGFLRKGRIVVVDTSALLAILLGEPERDRFIAAIAAASDPLISAATLLEASIVLRARTGSEGVQRLDELLLAAAIRPVGVDAAQAYVARDAFARFGRGRDPAGLNFGDCFSYALAKSQDRPLLFKGEDFGRTDVDVAVAATG
jgi:ribonuclease VapC